jgi:hypothetical protein
MQAEEVDQHLEAHKDALALEPKIPNLCAIYTAVRPVMKFAHALLFRKPKWRDALDKLVAALDEACPVTPNPTA